MCRKSFAKPLSCIKKTWRLRGFARFNKENAIKNNFAFFAFNGLKIKI